MPDWLIEILRQFPMVVVIGLAVWYADKRVREKEVRLEERADEHRKQLQEREDRLRREFREDRDAEIVRFRESQKATAERDQLILAAKDEQIKTLTKQLAELNRKLSG